MGEINTDMDIDVNIDIAPEAMAHVLAAQAAGKDRFDIDFSDIRKGEAVGRLRVQEKHLNGFGICFGTFIFNLADMTCGIAFLTMGGFGPTVDGNISFIAGAKAGDVLVCRAKVQKYGKKVSFVEGHIYTEEGALVASTDFRFFHL